MTPLVTAGAALGALGLSLTLATRLIAPKRFAQILGGSACGVLMLAAAAWETGHG